MKIDIDPSTIRTATPATRPERSPCPSFTMHKAFHGAREKTWDSLKSLSRPLRMFKVDVSIIEGKEKHSGQALKTLYFGVTGGVRPFFLGKCIRNRSLPADTRLISFLRIPFIQNLKLLTKKKISASSR